jgi:hypothetical protein
MCKAVEAEADEYRASVLKEAPSLPHTPYTETSHLHYSSMRAH